MTSLQMTQNNVGALVVVKPGEEKSIAGIITERGTKCSRSYFFGSVICCVMDNLVILAKYRPTSNWPNLNVSCAVKNNKIH